MKTLRFRARVSRMGRKYIINIPRALELEIAEFLGKEVIVTLEG